MKNAEGFVPIVVVAIISIIAAGLAGGAWYYNKQHAGICDTLNKKAEHSPCTNVQFTESQKATIAQSYAPCEVAFASPSTGTIFSVDAGCTPGSTGYLTDQGYNFFNAKSEKITNCNAFFVETGDTSLCDWLNNLDLKLFTSSTDTNTNSSTNTNTLLNTNASVIKTNDVVTGEFQYYFQQDAPWQNYGVYYKDGVLYHYLSATQAQPLDIGIDISLYHVSATRFGLLLWKKGETKNTYFGNLGNEPFPYETGIKPDFLFLNLETGRMTTLPEVSEWEEGETTFDRVYRVFSSINENFLLIEIGEYDIHASQFEPGLIESQPVKSRSIVYDIANNTFTTEDPISIFLSLYNTNIGTTNWNTISWDSKNDIIAAAPGGEGCGAYSTISFINLTTQTKETVGSQGDSWGGYDYVNETCNPRNGTSPSGKWQILYGKTADNTFAYRLYAPETTSQVLKKIIKDSSLWEGGSANAVTWDESHQYPIINKNGEVFVDFNQ